MRQAKHKTVFPKSGFQRYIRPQVLKKITIVGGGLAGLTLGIALRKASVPVDVFEAGNYPRHRVCGEFVSGRGLEVLRELDLFSLLEPHSIPVRTVCFRMRGSAKELRSLLPQAGVAISRYKLDAIMAEQFAASGGMLLAGQRFTDSLASPGVVRATGRRLQEPMRGDQWLGIKAHFKGLTLRTDLEIHCSEDGYVGFCILPDHQVNVCALFRNDSGFPRLKEQWAEMLAEHTFGVTGQDLRHAEFEEGSFCSVAGFNLKSFPLAANADCSIGDAATMIPPVTGNGMSMAFESARLAVGPLVSFSRGDLGWAEAKTLIGDALREYFEHRLGWAGRLHRLIFYAAKRPLLFSAGSRFPGILNQFFSLTRN